MSLSDFLASGKVFGVIFCVGSLILLLFVLALLLPQLRKHIGRFIVALFILGLGVSALWLRGESGGYSLMLLVPACLVGIVVVLPSFRRLGFLGRPGIGRLKRERNVAGLIKALQYSSWRVRSDAADALAELGEDFLGFPKPPLLPEPKIWPQQHRINDIRGTNSVLARELMSILADDETLLDFIKIDLPLQWSRRAFNSVRLNYTVVGGARERNLIDTLTRGSGLIMPDATVSNFYVTDRRFIVKGVLPGVWSVPVAAVRRVSLRDYGNAPGRHSFALVLDFGGADYLTFGRVPWPGLEQWVEQCNEYLDTIVRGTEKSNQEFYFRFAEAINRGSDRAVDALVLALKREKQDEVKSAILRALQCIGGRTAEQALQEYNVQGHAAAHIAVKE